MIIYQQAAPMRQLKITTSITNRDSQALEKYLQEVAKTDLISPEREVELALMIKAGDQRALDELVHANLRFVVSVAKQYQHQGLSLSDLINEGNLGLIKAAQKFDETKGFKFISYAVWRIRQSITLALSENGNIVRKPSNKISLINKINNAELLLLQTLERAPTNEELLELLQTKNVDIKEETLQLAIESRGKHTSLDMPVGEDGETTFGSFIEADADEHQREASYQELRETVRIGLKTSKLTELQRFAIILHFGLDPSLTTETVLAHFNIKERKLLAAYNTGIAKLKRDKHFKSIIAGEKLKEDEDPSERNPIKRFMNTANPLTRKTIKVERYQHAPQEHVTSDTNEEPTNTTVEAYIGLPNSNGDAELKDIMFFYSPGGAPIKQVQEEIITILEAGNCKEAILPTSIEEIPTEDINYEYIHASNTKAAIENLTNFLQTFSAEEHNIRNYVGLTKKIITKDLDQTILLFFFLYAIEHKEIDANTVLNYIQKTCNYVGLSKTAIVETILSGYRKIMAAEVAAQNTIG